jgi:hypothetical protein
MSDLYERIFFFCILNSCGYITLPFYVTYVGCHIVDMSTCERNDKTENVNGTAGSVIPLLITKADFLQ